MPATVVYCRISKDEAGEHLGVDRQQRACLDLAARHGLTVDDVLVDNDVSAYARKARPAFEQLVDRLQAGHVGTVVCYHADRLYRRAADLERLVAIVEANRAQVLTVAAGNVDLTTASGRMVARMLGAAAQHESERMGERCRMKHDELASSGRAPGGRAPFGYQWEFPDRERGKGNYVINETEADAVRRMADRALEGASMLAIARELDAGEVSTREGRPWHGASVRAALVNPAVAGLRVHRREVAGAGGWEPILDRATWEQVRAVIADPARKRQRPARKYLLAGLVQNPNGDPMNGRPDRAPDGTMTRRTYSTRFPANPSLSIGADLLEEFVVKAMLLRLDKAPLPVASPTDTSAGADVAAIEAELAELASLRGAGTISLAEWLAAREPLQERVAAAKAKAGTVRRSKSTLSILARPGAVRRAWERDELTFGEKRDIVAAVVARTTVLPASRGRWTPLDERVDVHWADSQLSAPPGV